MELGKSRFYSYSIAGSDYPDAIPKPFSSSVFLFINFWKSWNFQSQRWVHHLPLLLHQLLLWPWLLHHSSPDLPLIVLLSGDPSLSLIYIYIYMYWKMGSFVVARSAIRIHWFMLFTIIRYDLPCSSGIQMKTRNPSAYPLFLNQLNNDAPRTKSYKEVLLCENHTMILESTIWIENKELLMFWHLAIWFYSCVCCFLGLQVIKPFRQMFAREISSQSNDSDISIAKVYVYIRT